MRKFIYFHACTVTGILGRSEREREIDEESMAERPVCEKSFVLVCESRMLRFRECLCVYKCL